MHVYGEAQRVYDFQAVCAKPGGMYVLPGWLLIV